MITIGCYNQKGGVGKTATCVNLAAIFAEKGYRICICDMDGQINATQYLLTDNENYFSNGVYSENNYNVADLISGDCSAQNCLTYKTYQSFSNFKRKESEMAIIPGNPSINYVEFHSMFCLKEALSKIEEGFDFLFIDLPPSDNTAVAIALAACDYVICPSEAELDSINGFRKLLDLVEDLNTNHDTSIHVLGLFINKLMEVRSFQKFIQEQMQAFDENYLFETSIPNDPRVPEARGTLKPLEYYARSCKANKALHKLANEILTKIDRREE